MNSFDDEIPEKVREHLASMVAAMELSQFVASPMTEGLDHQIKRIIDNANKDLKGMGKPFCGFRIFHEWRHQSLFVGFDRI